jgi:hypothetical protein
MTMMSEMLVNWASIQTFMVAISVQIVTNSECTPQVCTSMWWGKVWYGCEASARSECMTERTT